MSYNAPLLHNPPHDDAATPEPAREIVTLWLDVERAGFEQQFSRDEIKAWYKMARRITEER